MLLLFNYAYEIIICQGKLNVVTDTQVCGISSTESMLANGRLYLDNDDDHHDNNRSYHYSGV